MVLALVASWLTFVVFAPAPGRDMAWVEASRCWYLLNVEKRSTVLTLQKATGLPLINEYSREHCLRDGEGDELVCGVHDCECVSARLVR